MRKSFIATVTVLSSVACGSFVDLASADLVGSYQTGAGSSDTMTVYYRNDQAVRVDVGEGRYMLITGSNVYMVENEGGRTTAVDMDQMGAALQRSGMTAQAPATGANADGNVSFRKTGRTETVAGYKGQVFEVTADGKTTEYVGSNDADVVALGRAFLVMGKRMSRSFGRNDSAAMDRAVRTAQAEGVGGMLRSGNDVRLTSVTKKDVDAAFYQLPANANVQAVPDMGNVGNMGDMMRQAQESAARSSQAQMQQQQQQQQANPAAGIAGEAARAAQEETQNQVRESVQNAIRGLFGR
jgi:hypothetical protein